MNNKLDPSAYAGERRSDLSNLSRLDMAEGAMDFLISQRKALDAELGALVTWGMWNANFFWEEVKYHLEENPGEVCYVGTRARFVGNSFQATWYRNRYKANANGESAKVYSTHLRKGKGYRYSMSHFQTKHEKPWLRELISNVEDGYAPLRQRADYISKMRQQLTVYERAVMSMLNEQERETILKYKRDKEENHYDKQKINQRN